MSLLVLFRRAAASNTGAASLAVSLVPQASAAATTPSVSVSTPQVVCEVAFSTLPGAPPVWTDVSAYVLQFSTRRGRNMELDRNEAGTMQVLFDNRDRRFEPLYASSPYYPNVVPMRRIRMRAKYSATSTAYPVFDGYVQEWPQSYEGWGNFGQVQVACIDAFALLNNIVVSGSRPRELTSERVAWVLDQAGWPNNNRVISPGVSTVQEYTFDNYNALQHLQEMAQTENSVVFVDASGRLVFQNRTDRLVPLAPAVAGTFGDADGELPYESVTVNYSDQQIRNDIHVTVANDETNSDFSAVDAVSRDTYWLHSYPVTTWHPVASSEPADFAAFLLSRYKDPLLRIDEAAVRPTQAQAVWDAAVNSDIGAKVIVSRRPRGGSAVTQQSFVEQVSVTNTGADTEVQWRLSPADTTTYWKLGAAGYGELDTATRVPY